ncbi:MAG: YkgJ family cysteine cluster protein [Alphaproteobacteria bacterium]|nr:YkgJ family cysteine cluster protein [Alphaproteobacteria bacterium]
MPISFHCDQCGLCCRNIKHIDLLREYDKGNGVCKFLDEATNRCLIYATRPDFCNVAVGYEKYFSDIYTEEEYLRLNYKACTFIKESFGKEAAKDDET